MAILPFGPTSPPPPTTPPTTAAPDEMIPLPPDGRGSRSFWKKQIDADVERISQFKDEWDANVLAYRAKTLKNTPATDTVIVPRDFSYVEQKKSSLFFQTPEVHLTAEQASCEDAVPIFQAVVNKYLGEDELDALSTMHEVIFDALCPSGLMVSIIGYENFQDGTKPMQVGTEPDPENALSGSSLGQPDPSMLPGSVLGLGAPAPMPMRPVMEQVPNIVHQRYFMSRLSTPCVLVPHDWSGSVYDRAPYLGYRGEDDWDVLKRRYNLPDDMPKPSGKQIESEKLKLPGESQQATGKATTDKVTYSVLWYRTAYFDQSEKHPEKFRELVLLDGRDEPLVHRNSPLQRINDQGELIGMYGNPVHIGALRYVSDTAFPPSECSIARASGDELNRSRTQMILSRDRSRPMRFADLSRIGGEVGLEKIRKNIDQGIIPLETYDPNNPPIGAVGLAHYSTEDFSFNDIIGRDEDNVWSLGNPQRGQANDHTTSATEVAKADEWAQTRLDAERRAALRYYLGAVRKIASLIQLFADDTDYVRIVGPDKVARLQAWDKTHIQGKFAFSCNPNSAIRIDQAQAQTAALKRYELLAKDPNVNRITLLEDIAETSDLDQKKLIIPPDKMPKKGPEPVNLSFRLSGDELTPANPIFPLWLSLLQQSGYQIDPAILQYANDMMKHQAEILNASVTGQPPSGPRPVMPNLAANAAPQEHGGMAPKVAPLNKHHSDQTGELSGPPVNRPSPTVN